MARRGKRASAREEDYYADSQEYPEFGEGALYGDEDEGPILDPRNSLVDSSQVITDIGAPLLSYTNTMSRFYRSRKQRLSLGRHVCAVCGERIGFWSYESPEGQRSHDGCYERLAWQWTHLFAQQQRMAAAGELD